MTWKATEQELDLVSVTPSCIVVSLPPLPAFEPRDVCMWTTAFDTIPHLYHFSREPETKLCHPGGKCCSDSLALYREGSTETRYCGPYSRNFIIQAASFKCLQGPGSERD